jgi:hypothetical protein
MINYDSKMAIQENGMMFSHPVPGCPEVHGSPTDTKETCNLIPTEPRAVMQFSNLGFCAALLYSRYATAYGDTVSRLETDICNVLMTDRCRLNEACSASYTPEGYSGR